MMTSRSTVLTLVLFLSGLCGCQGLNRVFHRAGTHVAPRAPEPRAALVADFGFINQEADRTPNQQRDPNQSAQHSPGTSPNQQNADVTTQATNGDDPIDPTDEEEEPPVRRRFTAPSEAVRQLALLAAATTGVSVDDDEIAIAGAGKEVAEALAGGATQFIGQPGLAAPQPTVAGVVVSRPGLQQGPATGLGFASPFNILTPQTNPASGNMGRCTDLTRAGFFGGNTPDCQAHFQRQARFRRVPSR